ncbi:MAG: DUF2934 domain-containing protein [Sphingobium sp.]
MANAQEKKIRERAHAIWLEEGSPSGREQDHWEQAEREVTAQSDAPKAKPGRKPSTKPAAVGNGETDAATPPAPKKAKSNTTTSKAPVEPKQPKRTLKPTPKQA